MRDKKQGVPAALPVFLHTTSVHTKAIGLVGVDAVIGGKGIAAGSTTRLGQVVDTHDRLTTGDLDTTVEVVLIVDQRGLGEDRIGAVRRQRCSHLVAIGELVGAGCRGAYGPRKRSRESTG